MDKKPPTPPPTAKKSSTANVVGMALNKRAMWTPRKRQELQRKLENIYRLFKLMDLDKQLPNKKRSLPVKEIIRPRPVNPMKKSTSSKTIYGDYFSTKTGACFDLWSPRSRREYPILSPGRDTSSSASLDSDEPPALTDSTVTSQRDSEASNATIAGTSGQVKSRGVLKTVDKEGKNADKKMKKSVEDKLLERDYMYGKKLLELTLQLQEKTAKLETYEKIYGDLKGGALAKVAVNVEGGDEKSRPGAQSIQSLDLVRRLHNERNYLEKQREESDFRYRELETRFSKLQIEMNQMKIEGKEVKTEAKSNMRFKDFELDRVHMLLAEAENNFKTSQSENHYLRKKVESLNLEMNHMKSDLEKEVTRLSLELQTKSSNLAVYEKMEDSLDQLVLKAANASEKELPVLCENVKPIPVDSRRRLQQSFDLAKRVYELEKIVNEQKNETMNLYDERQVLRIEVEGYKASVSKPVSQLIKTISDKNMEIEKMRNRNVAVEKQCKDLMANEEVLQKSLKNLKLYQEEMLRLYKAQSNLVSLLPNKVEPESQEPSFLFRMPRIPKHSVFCKGPVEPRKRPKAVEMKEFMDRVSSDPLSDDMEINGKAERGRSQTGSYFLLRKRHPSKSTPGCALRPVPLKLSKVKPSKCTEF